MLLKKGDIYVNILDKDHISGYKNEGWEEVKQESTLIKKAEKSKK